MIAALFYPKELKEVIADLRAKGDLNERALRNFNFLFYCTILPFLILGGGLFALSLIEFSEGQ